jgi:two-component system chemotaxis response regulator CheY
MPADPKSSNVLVVDDSPTMRRMVVTSLRAVSRIRSSEAGSGLEAIEQLAVRPIDLMVLDLNMPDMHGMEVIDFVRGHRAYRNIPIVVLTTKGESVSREKALAAGANHYLTKPFDPTNLAQIVTSLLKGPEQQANG